MDPASAGSPGILPAGSPGKFQARFAKHPKTRNPLKNKKIHSKTIPTSKPGFWQVSGFADASTLLPSNDLKFQEEVSI